MSSKMSRIRKHREKSSPKVNLDVASFLRTVDSNEAFHFYEGMDKPTGRSARNLTDFLNEVKSVKTESLLFHLERKDFENWVNRILGDKTLANRIGKMSLKRNSDLRARMQSVLEKRLEELGQSCLTVIVDPGLTVAPQHSMS
jgi:hypothetical protein